MTHVEGMTLPDAIAVAMVFGSQPVANVPPAQAAVVHRAFDLLRAHASAVMTREVEA